MTSTGEPMTDSRRQPESLVRWTRPALLEGTSRGELPWNTRRWLFILPLIVLPFLAVSTTWAARHVEQDVEQTAQELLENAGIDTTTLTFHGDHRDVEVRGTLPSNVEGDSIVTLLESGRGADNEDIREVRVTAVPAPPAALGSISLEARSDGQTLTLSGTVPSQLYKDELHAATAVTGLTIVDDQLTVSALQPASGDADAQIRKFSSILGGLISGSFTSAELFITDDGPVLGMIVATDAAAAELLEAVSGDGVEVSAPPVLGALDISVTYDGIRIVLTGTVFSTAQGLELVTSASSVVGAGNVVNNLAVTDLEETVPRSGSRVGALSSVLSTFGGLLAADASINDTDITVNGIAADPEGQAITVGAVAATSGVNLRPGGEIRLAFPAPEELSLQDEIDLLQEELDALQDEIRETVVFPSDSPELDEAGRRTLDKVVAAMSRYPRPVIEIGGHTDSSGDDQYNLDLSQRRAESVVAYIASAGVDETRLLPIGFGETQPIAEEGTDAARRQNRRVEFLAKESF